MKLKRKAALLGLLLILSNFVVLFSSAVTDYAIDDGSSPVIAWQNYPVATYSSITDTTYIVYMTNESPMHVNITSYNHTTREWSDSYNISHSPIDDDAHLAPTIVIADNGTIYVFYGSHLIKPRYRYSLKPITDVAFNLSEWSDEHSFGTMVCDYHNTLKTQNGTIYVIYRDVGAARDFHYNYSVDNGATWSSESILLWSNGGLGEQYISNIITEEKGGSTLFHFTWMQNNHDGIGYKKNLYYGYLNTTDRHCYNITGADLGTNFSFAEWEANCLVFNSTDSLSYQNLSSPALDIDSSGYPHIVFVFNNVSAPQNATNRFEDWYYKYAFWNISNSEWEIHNISVHIHRDKFEDAVDARSYTNITFFLPVQSDYIGGVGERGYNASIQRWEWNGTDMNLIETILTGHNSTIEFEAQLIDKGNPTANMVFSEASWDNTGAYFDCEKLWLWGKDAGFIRRGELPVNLSNPVPANNSFNVSISVGNISINISDGNGDNVTYYIYGNFTGARLLYAHDTTVGNETVNVTIPLLSQSHNYSWSVNATDDNGVTWVNETYLFRSQNKTTTIIRVSYRTYGGEVATVTYAATIFTAISVIALVGIISIKYVNRRIKT